MFPSMKTCPAIANTANIVLPETEEGTCPPPKNHELAGEN